MKPLARVSVAVFAQVSASDTTTADMSVAQIAFISDGYLRLLWFGAETGDYLVKEIYLDGVVTSWPPHCSQCGGLGG